MGNLCANNSKGNANQSIHMRKLIVIVCAVLLSCSASKYTESDAVNDAVKAATTYPEPVLNYFRGNWPCITTKDSISTNDSMRKAWEKEKDSIIQDYAEYIDRIGKPEPVIIRSTDCTDSVNAYRENEKKILSSYSKLEKTKNALQNKLDSVPNFYIERTKWIADRAESAATKDSCVKVIAKKDADYNKISKEKTEEYEGRVQAEANAKVFRNILFWLGLIFLIVIILGVFGKKIKSAIPFLDKL